MSEEDALNGLKWSEGLTLIANHCVNPDGHLHVGIIHY